MGGHIHRTLSAYITDFSAPGGIRIGRLPIPDVGPTDVLVEVSALAVNHVDTFVRSGAYRTGVRFPFVIGRDLVGTVLDAGADAEFRPGQRVWCNSMGYGGRPGTFAEHVTVPAERLYPLPDGVDPVDAVTVLHTGATAYLGLFRRARLTAGETIVVVGAGGGVGSAVVQCAAAAGARVIAVDRPDNATWCRDCGAAAVLDRDSPSLPADLAELTAPSGVDVFWDNSGRNEFTEILPTMSLGGRIVLLAGLHSRPVLPVGQVYTRDVGILGFALSNAPADVLADAAVLINRELAAGRLRGRIREKLPLTAAATAHEMQETRGGPPGRIILQP